MTEPLPPLLPPDDLPFADLARLSRPTPARDGPLILARKSDFLGDPCVLCGADSDCHLLTAKLSWSPRWAAAAGRLLLIGGLLSLAMTRRAKVTYCLCEHHHQRRTLWSRSTWVFAVLTFLSFAAIAFIFSTTDSRDWPLAILAILAALCLGSAGMMQLAIRLSQPLRATLIDDDGIISIRGACTAFLNTLPGR